MPSHFPPPDADELLFEPHPGRLRVVLASVIQGGKGDPGSPGLPGDSGFTRVAGGNLSALTAVWEDEDGNVLPLDNDDDAHIDRYLGVTLTGASAGGEIIVQRFGGLDATGGVLAPGRVWLGANGTLTQTPPTAGHDLRIGVAVSPDRLILDPSEPIFLEE